jgi:hypothetical protein
MGGRAYTSHAFVLIEFAFLLPPGTARFKQTGSGSNPLPAVFLLPIPYSLFSVSASVALLIFAVR